MGARLLVRTKEVRDDGSIVEIVIWDVPVPVAPSTHLYEYRLFFGSDGSSRVRYDNERGKGDHRHVGSDERSYDFTSIEQLLEDFERDIADWS